MHELHDEFLNEYTTHHSNCFRFQCIPSHTQFRSTFFSGSKPVVCEICGQRFGSGQQMAAHYQRHREARLQEFAILKKRRQPDIESETKSESMTTVGSFNRVHKSLKTRMTEPYRLPKSYGTEQSYNISRKSNRSKLPVISAKNGSDNRNELTNLPATPVGTLPMIKGSAVSASNSENMNSSASFRLPRLSAKQNVPGPDPERISVINNVVGVAKTIETSKESGFVEKAENELISSRMEAVALAGRSPSPLSYRSKSGIPEFRKPKYLANKEFWDTGSHMTDGLGGYSPVSGYDPNHRGNNSGSVRQRKTATSLPSIR